MFRSFGILFVDKQLYITDLMKQPLLLPAFVVFTTRWFKLFIVLTILPVCTFAQADSTHKRRASKHTKVQKPQPTPEEKKKAAVKRVLKEKNFHLPDTASHHKK